MFFIVVLWLVDLQDGGTTHYTLHTLLQNVGNYVPGALVLKSQRT